jgi:hypothetical protein
MRFASLSILAALGVSTVNAIGISSALYSDLKYYWQYSTSSYFASCPKPNNNTLIGYFSDSTTDTQGFVARDDRRQEIIVAFRGTSDDRDITTDFDFQLTPYISPGVKPPVNATVHTGFMEAYNSVAAQIFKMVDAQLKLHPGYVLISTGHSLGGALSSLGAVSLKQRHPTHSVRLYSYGQPRTGNAIYANWVNSLIGLDKSFRSVHVDDGVPTFVPTSFGFQHHGTEYWQTVDPPSFSTVKKCVGNEDPTCSVSIPSKFIDQGHLVYFGIFFQSEFSSSAFIV